MFWLFSLFEKLYFLISNVSSRSCFPKPLKASEEKEYIEAFLRGDMEARDELIEHNLRLVAHIVKKYTAQGETDDLISIGTIGLIKAINTYNPQKSAHLATYASRCIENEILMYLRAGKKRKNETSLQEPVGVDREGNEISLFDILKSDDRNISDTVELNINSEELYRKINNCLSVRERLVVIMRYGLSNESPLTQKEVAKRLEISRSYVSRIEKKALEKLKNFMETQPIKLNSANKYKRSNK